MDEAGPAGHGRSLVVLHPSGVKHPRRIGQHSEADWADIPDAAITIIPAGAHYRWCMTGPIDLAHLYVDVARLKYMIESDFDRDPTKVQLMDAVGVTDPLLSEIIKTMLAPCEGRASRSPVTPL
jgi:hypothetical protein